MWPRTEGRLHDQQTSPGGCSCPVPFTVKAVKLALSRSFLVSHIFIKKKTQTIMHMSIEKSVHWSLRLDVSAVGLC